jgi:uncharacterized protein YyaL (SSP411 family)
MERECFEDEEVALLMNAHFVSIKVDREERPDIDAVYMDALQALNGNGGWPLNMVCLPDGKPVWGGTYFPKPAWMHYLAQLARLWKDNPEKFGTQADQLIGFVQRLDSLPPPPDSEPEFALEQATRAVIPLLGRLDTDLGGWPHAPKFPTPVVWRFFLEYAWLTRQPDIERHVLLTLRRICQGGIFDHLAGGFARYSVDAKWHVPHFEKMLYDNGQMLSLLSLAQLWRPQPLWAQTAEATFGWLQAEMKGPGGYFAALDADSEGVEGKFYVWTKSEVEAVLGPEAPLFCAAYHVTEEGNWEHGLNVLWLPEPLHQVAERQGVPPLQLEDRLAAARQKLLAHRALRTRPAQDDKTLTSWNALAIAGLAHLYLATGNPQALAAAQHTMHTLLANMATPDGGLFRTFKDGNARLPAFAEDYACVIQALLALHQATLQPQHIADAQRLMEYAEAHFSDAEHTFFLFTHRQQVDALTPKRETQDSVMPSSNAMLAHSLWQLGILTGNTAHTARARRMMARMLPLVEKHLASYAHWGSLLLRLATPTHEVAVVGPDAVRTLEELRRQAPHPFTVWAAAWQPQQCLGPLLANRWPTSTQTLIYVCQHGQCQRPVSTIQEALQLLQRA